MKNHKKLLEEFEQDLQSGSCDITLKAEQVLSSFIEESQGLRISDFQRELLEVCRKILAIQPQMALVRHLVSGAIKLAKHDNVKSLEAFKSYFTNFREFLKNSVETIANSAQRKIEHSTTIGTLSYSKAVRSAILQANKSKKKINLIISESVPGSEGITLANELHNEHIETLLIPDMAWGKYAKSCDLFLLGCDCITEGFIINKTGSYILAVLAKNFSIPFVVLGSRLKIMPARFISSSEMKESTLENWGTRVKPESRTSAPLFEAVPLELVSEIICEDGKLEEEKIRAKVTEFEELEELIRKI